MISQFSDFIFQFQHFYFSLFPLKKKSVIIPIPASSLDLFLLVIFLAGIVVI